MENVKKIVKNNSNCFFFFYKKFLKIYLKKTTLVSV